MDRNATINGRLSTRLFSLLPAAVELNPALQVRFVHYAQSRIRWAVVGRPRGSDKNTGKLRCDGILLRVATETLPSRRKYALSQSEHVADLTTRLNTLNAGTQKLSPYAFVEARGKSDKSFRKQGSECISHQMEDEPLFRYLRAEIAERFSENSDATSQIAASPEAYSIRSTDETLLSKPNLNVSLRAYWERFSTAVRFRKQRWDRFLPWHAPVDRRFSAAVSDLVAVYTRLDPAQKLQFVSYAQVRIERAILQRLRD